MILHILHSCFFTVSFERIDVLFRRKEHETNSLKHENVAAFFGYFVSLIMASHIAQLFIRQKWITDVQTLCA